MFLKADVYTFGKTNFVGLSLTYLFTGFWGGLVPENAMNTSSLEDLLEAGALGLKVFVLFLFLSWVLRLIFFSNYYF